MRWFYVILFRRIKLTPDYQGTDHNLDHRFNLFLFLFLQMMIRIKSMLCARYIWPNSTSFTAEAPLAPPSCNVSARGCASATASKACLAESEKNAKRFFRSQLLFLIAPIISCNSQYFTVLVRIFYPFMVCARKCLIQTMIQDYGQCFCD